ncbi:hypothetical protein KPATCC21470_6833 [Kitasatospora purpeofusca]
MPGARTGAYARGRSWIVRVRAEGAGAMCVRAVDLRCCRPRSAAC